MTAPRGDGDLAAFRRAVRAALAERLEPRAAGERAASVLGAGSDDLEAGRAYLRRLAGGGWVVPSWPVEYGGMGAGADEAAVVQQELARGAGPDLYPYLVGLALVGPTLLAHGTPEQCARWLPPIRAGEEIWCQMFSEPDAGSDLAGLTTRATRDGDTWQVSGAKVWTSRAHYAQWGLLLARHDRSVPKHAGITAFALDMTAPGVTVRPLLQMNGDAHFTEVFLDEVRVPDAHRIGAPGEGWRVALTTLAHERGAGTAGSGWLLDEDRLLRLARDLRVTRDPVVRQRLAQVVIEMRVMALTARRARARREAGRPGPEGSGMKLRGSRALRAYTDLAAHLLGPHVAAGDGGGHGAPGEWQTLLLTAPSLGIRGGTDEVQRNIVGERVLGLPTEPRVDRDVPFEDLPRSGPAPRRPPRAGVAGAPD